MRSNIATQRRRWWSNSEGTLWEAQPRKCSSASRIKGKGSAKKTSRMCLIASIEPVPPTAIHTHARALAWASTLRPKSSNGMGGTSGKNQSVEWEVASFSRFLYTERLPRMLGINQKRVTAQHDRTEDRAACA